MGERSASYGRRLCRIKNLSTLLGRGSPTLNPKHRGLLLFHSRQVAGPCFITISAVQYIRWVFFALMLFHSSGLLQSLQVVRALPATPSTPPLRCSSLFFPSSTEPSSALCVQLQSPIQGFQLAVNLHHHLQVILHFLTVTLLELLH